MFDCRLLGFFLSNKDISNNVGKIKCFVGYWKTFPSNSHT